MKALSTITKARLCCAMLIVLLIPQVQAQVETLSITADQPSITYPPVKVIGPASPYRQFNGVEITGSSIIRKEQTQTLPVQIVTRAEIQRSGKQNIADYLQTLPVIFNSFSPVVLGGVQSGYSGGAVHGLQTGTLVLVNGRRLANYGRQTSAGLDNGGVDLNALPLSAIDRVEILTDGASSVYGTDAQTGVINIITRTDRPGVEITVDHRMPDGQKGLGSRVDFSFGRGQLAKDGYSWYVATDVSHQQELQGRDRPYAAAGRYLVQQNGQDYWAYGSNLPTAQTSPTLATSKSAPYTRLWNADYQNGQCANGNVPAWGKTACLYNNYKVMGLYPEAKVARLHAQGQLQINADLTAYTELSWQHSRQRRSFQSWAPYSAQIGNTPGAPGYDLAVANGFDPAKGVWLLYSGSELGAPSRWYALDTRRWVTGLKGQWQDWNFNTSYYFSDNAAAYTKDEGMDNIKLYPNLGIDAQGILTNPALLSPLSGNDAATTQLRQQLLSIVNPNTGGNSGIGRFHGLDLKASRIVGEMEGQDVLLALGTDWRQETAQFTRINAGGANYNGQRTVWAQFAELQLPLPHEMEALTSLRNDHYSGFGNTTHAKLSAKWTPNPQWLVRGAWGTGFRAPAVAQMQETGRYLSASVLWTCTNELQAVATQLGAQCPPNNLYSIFTQGSSQLKPELSTQWNFGVRFSPDRNQTWSVDYWRIDMRNKITSINQDIILSHPAQYIANLERGTNGQLQLYSPMTNMGNTQTSGLDVSWAFRRPTDWGQLQLGLNGTLLLSSRYQLADGEPYVSDLNTYSKSRNVVVPKLRTRWYAGLQQANWYWLGTINHVGSYDDGGVNVIQANTGQSVTLDHHRVPAWWTLDLMAMHQWSPQTSLRLGIENVFNRQAPLDFSFFFSANFGTNPMLQNVWGRTVQVSLTHRF